MHGLGEVTRHKARNQAIVAVERTTPPTPADYFDSFVLWSIEKLVSFLLFFFFSFHFILLLDLLNTELSLLVDI